MEFIPLCTRTTNCTSLFGMPVSHASFSHKLVKPKETAWPSSTHSQHTCSWNFYRCQQHWVLRVKVFGRKKKVNDPSYRFMGSDRCMFDFASACYMGILTPHQLVGRIKNTIWDRAQGCCSNGTCYFEKIV